MVGDAVETEREEKEGVSVAIVNCRGGAGWISYSRCPIVFPIQFLPLSASCMQLRFHDAGLMVA